jgi:glycosyltransferase involved in cell wall biosynthesis
MPETRVIFLTCWYPNHKNPGKGIFVRNHAIAIKKYTTALLVVSINVEPSSKLLRYGWTELKDEYGIDTLSLTIESKFYKLVYALIPLMRWIYRNSILRKTTAFKPNIIHSNVIAPAGIVGYSIASKLGIPHIITEHWSKIDKFMKKNLSSGIAKTAYKKTFAITAVSEFLGKNIRRYAPDATIITVANTVDTEVYCTKQPIVAASGQPIVFTATASWKLPKRPELFIAALEQLAQSGKHIVLNMIGNGPQAEQLKKQKHSFQINWLGYLQAEAIAEVLSKSNFFLHASDVETFSVVVAEALCTGTPAIVSATGALPEFVQPGVCIAAENTVQDWTQKIELAISASFDPDVVSASVSAKVNPSEIGKRFATLYRDALGIMP